METVSAKSARSRNALLVIDVQVGLVELMPTEIRTSVLPRIQNLLSRARASGTPVIYIQHDGPKGHPLETQTQGWELHPSIKPLDSEPVIRKRESDSFFETTLQQELQRRGIPQWRTAPGTNLPWERERERLQHPKMEVSHHTVLHSLEPLWAPLSGPLFMPDSVNRFSKRNRILPFFCGVQSFPRQGNSYRGRKRSFVHFEGFGERHTACSIS